MDAILDQIISVKRKEVVEAKRRKPVAALELGKSFGRETFSLRASLEDGFGIIAEVKRMSPSMGLINKAIGVGQIAAGYASAGVSAVSVLTDREYFGGSNADLVAVRQAVKCPVLRKEFIIDEYQVIESKFLGADSILVLASVLSPAEMKRFTRLAHDLGMEVLAEAHNEAEVETCLAAEPDVVGINNRDLRDFSISLEVSRRLAPAIPASTRKISESGIHLPADVLSLRKLGYHGFLIGQAFMRKEAPAVAAREFIQSLQEAERREVA